MLIRHDRWRCAEFSGVPREFGPIEPARRYEPVAVGGLWPDAIFRHRKCFRFRR